MGETERSATDRNRDRRIKKKHQKKKAKMQEKKLQEKVRRAGAKDGSGKLDRGTTMKVIEKAVKSGQVKLVSNILMIHYDFTSYNFLRDALGLLDYRY